MHDKNGHQILVGDQAKATTRKGKKLEGEIVEVSHYGRKVRLYVKHRFSMWLHPSQVAVQLNDPDYQENEHPVAQ